MTRRTHRAQLLVALLAALLTSGAAVAQSLVLCLGPNGHRALEIEHRATGCPDAASPSSSDASLIKQAPGDCLDLSSARMGPTTPSEERVPTAPLAVALALPDRSPGMRSRGATPLEQRAGPPSVLAHLRTTVLLV